MGVITDYFANLGRSSEVATVPFWQEARALTDYRTPSNCLATYHSNSIVYAATQVLATAISSAQLESNNESLNKVLANPYGGLSQSDFLQQLVIYKRITGDLYVNVLHDGSGTSDGITGLQILKTELCKPIIDKHGKILSIVIEVGGRPVQEIDYRNIIHVRNGIDLQQPWKGLSDLVPLARYIQIDNAAYEYIQAFYENNATPAGLLTLEHRVNDTERKRLRTMWKEAFTGKSGWNSIGVIDKSAKFQKIGASLKELESTLYDSVETRICMGLGVPAILISSISGLKYATYSNYEQAIQSFYFRTLRPEWRAIEQQFNLVLRDITQDESLEIAFDYTDVDAMNENEQTRRNFILELIKQGVIDNEEGLRLLEIEAEASKTRKEAKRQAPPMMPVQNPNQSPNNEDTVE